MLCWFCEKLSADRDGICHVCREAAGHEAEVPRLRLDARLSVAVLAGLLSISAGLLTPTFVSPSKLPWHPPPIARAHVAPVLLGYQTTMVSEVVKRKVYPYSLVPGGAETVNQARHYMDDPAIKVQYANIDLARLRKERLTTNLTGYVSYRWGEKVYWTAKKITLRAGETVFTDGVHIVRGRCLNCYSALPMQPIRPHEPTELVLDTPVEMPMTVYSFPRLPVLAPELPVPPGELTPTVPVLPVVGAPIGKTPGGIWFPIIPIIPPIHHKHHQPVGPPTPLVPPPVAVVPEPNLAWLVAIAFAAIAGAHGLRRRRATSEPKR